MKLRTKIALGLISSVCAVGIATAANHEMKHGQKHEMDCDGMDMMRGHMMKDPVATANKHLSELKTKLGITKDQEPAWKTFSDQVNAQAKNMASMHDRMKGNMQNMPMTAPDRMAMMAGMMKDRAQTMATMAEAVKTLYAALTPEQKITFDKLHMSHMKSMGHMKSMDHSKAMEQNQSLDVRGELGRL
ncbi:MAG: Spy/CpxP family protein refolding chaperone [Sulfuriferula sp.]